jgi:hypothetical protein
MTPPNRSQGRLLEIFPGALTWLVLLLPPVVAFTLRTVDPTKLWILGVGAIALDAYWFVRTMATVRAVRASLKAMKECEGEDWWERCLQLSPAAGDPSLRDVVHVALIPTYTERYEVLLETVRALAEQNYPAHQKAVAIITRTTDTGGIENVRRLREEFGESFAAFIHIKDPLLPGIVVGKSAAMAYAGPVLRQACDEMGLDPATTMVTDLDSDFRLHRQYFAYLTYQFCSTPGRLTSIWQPVPIFMNNIWRVPAAVRVMATASTQWQMFLHQNPARLIMFASYTMPMQLLSEVGYWDADVIPEDSRFFWKSFFHYGEKLQVLPAFLPVYGDAPKARTYSATFASQYNQIKRWAWGVTDISYVSARLLKHVEIPWSLRFRRYRQLVFNHLTWTTLPVLLLVGASLPAFIDLDYSLSIPAQVVGWTSFTVLTMAFLNTIQLIQIDNRTSPKPLMWGWWKRRWSDLQLFMYPIAGLTLSVFPALEAQTRLMFGAYLEYKVTEKE